MRTGFCSALALVGLLAAAAPASAHHAFAAEFDVNQPVKVHGTITRVEWVNPHAWLYVDVKGTDGKVVNWHFELGPPNALFRLGWKKDAIPAGIEVDISGYRAKNGENVGNGRSITLPDGRELFAGGSAPGAGGPSAAPKE
ncbi:MAG: hypothetical protein LAP40_06880 [Acidobacteriia bacterium]|nr:hypothetical protein [Terriglobia bacterium]